MQMRTRTITFAKIARRPGQATLFERGFQDDLERALSPEYRVTRYGRTWRFARPKLIDHFYLMGKLGFERLATEAIIRYDDDLEDFVSDIRPSEQGSVSHFAIDLNSQILVFEERPPDIRRQSFLGALRALLRESDSRFEVETLADVTNFHEWIETVERVVRFSAALRRPNPEWRPRTQAIRDLIEPTGADRVDITATVDDPEAGKLTVEDSVLGQAVEHASEGYGQIRAVGIERGRRRFFSSVVNVQTSQVSESPEDNSETIFDKLIRALRDRSH